jgi:hypothetical protein
MTDTTIKWDAAVAEGKQIIERIEKGWLRLSKDDVHRMRRVMLAPSQSGPAAQWR